VPPTGAPIPVTDAAVVDDMLEQPLPKIQGWVVRIVPPSVDDEMTRLIRWLKFGGQARPNDNIDSTIPPRQPEPPAVPEIPQPILARMLLPLR
jgi:hypothetical protein